MASAASIANAAGRALAKLLEASDRETTARYVATMVEGARDRSAVEGSAQRFRDTIARLTPSRVIGAFAEVAALDGDQLGRRLFEAMARAADRHELTWDDVDAASKGRGR